MQLLNYMLWWKRTTGKGVLEGMIVGSIVTIVWASFCQLA